MSDRFKTFSLSEASKMMRLSPSSMRARIRRSKRILAMSAEGVTTGVEVSGGVFAVNLGREWVVIVDQAFARFAAALNSNRR